MGRATNVHSQPELLAPVDAAWEGGATSSGVTKADSQVAVLYLDTVVIAGSDTVGVVASVSPQQRTARGSIVQFEFSVVVAVWGNSTSVRKQACLEVDGVVGGGISYLGEGGRI